MTTMLQGSPGSLGEPQASTHGPGGTGGTSNHDIDVAAAVAVVAVVAAIKSVVRLAVAEAGAD